MWPLVGKVQKLIIIALCLFRRELVYQILNLSLAVYLIGKSNCLLIISKLLDCYLLETATDSKRLCGFSIWNPSFNVTISWTTASGWRYIKEKRHTILLLKFSSPLHFITFSRRNTELDMVTAIPQCSVLFSLN